MLQDKEFADVTLASNDEKHIDARRIILSSQSFFLQKNSETELEKICYYFSPKS